MPTAFSIIWFASLQRQRLRAAAAAPSSSSVEPRTSAPAARGARSMRQLVEARQAARCTVSDIGFSSTVAALRPCPALTAPPASPSTSPVTTRGLRRSSATVRLAGQHAAPAAALRPRSRSAASRARHAARLLRPEQRQRHARQIRAQRQRLGHVQPGAQAARGDQRAPPGPPPGARGATAAAVGMPQLENCAPTSAVHARRRGAARPAPRRCRPGRRRRWSRTPQLDQPPRHRRAQMPQPVSFTSSRSPKALHQRLHHGCSRRGSRGRPRAGSAPGRR